MKTQQITITVTAPDDVDVKQVLTDYIMCGVELDRGREQDLVNGEDEGDEEAIRRLSIIWGNVS